MDQVDLERVSKLMMLATSSNDNEALLALRKANDILSGNNLSWKEFLISNYKNHPSSKRFSSEKIIYMLKYLQRNANLLPSKGMRQSIDEIISFWNRNYYLDENRYNNLCIWYRAMQRGYYSGPKKSKASNHKTTSIFEIYVSKQIIIPVLTALALMLLLIALPKLIAELVY